MGKGRFSSRFRGRLVDDSVEVVLIVSFGSTSVGGSFSVFFGVFVSSSFGSLLAREGIEARESTEPGDGSVGVLISHASLSLTEIGLLEIPPSPGSAEVGVRNKQRECGQMRCQTQSNKSQRLC